MRRIQLIGQYALCLWMATAAAVALAQAPSDPQEVESRLLVEPDRDVLDALAEARQNIDRKQYHSAVQLLQLVLDRPEDDFLAPDFQDQNRNRGGTRKEAQRMLLALPAEGLAAYELEYGASARQQLTTAQDIDDFTTIAEVARRFAATTAGYDAVVLLAAHASDESRPLEAAMLLESLNSHPKRTPQLLLREAICWSRAGRSARGLAALRVLRKLDPSGKVQIGGREVTISSRDDEAIKWLQTWASGNLHEPQSEVDRWTMVGGDPTRNATAAKASPVGGKAWDVSMTAHLVLDGRENEDRRLRTRIQQGLDDIRQSLQEENSPIAPASQPLVIGDTVVYRTVGDITAVSLRTGELVWRSAIVDEALVRLLYTRALESRYRTATLESHLERRAFRDSAAGTLSSDGQSVFGLEDLDATGAVSAFVETQAANKLVAYDLAGGRILWEVGGPRGSKPPELSALYFLGPPLPLDDRLYVLAESQGALQLLVLKQDDDRQSVKLEWSQTLIATDQSINSHPLRRLAGVSPSFADGLLICPTASGAAVAIDVRRRMVVWGHQYASLVRPDQQFFNGPIFERAVRQDVQLEEADRAGRWIDSTPLIADGRVLLTARDSDQLYCLDLVDGQEIWRMPRDDWMYVACVVDGRVVLVGRSGIAAVHLSDGTEVDAFALAELSPAGRGVRVDGSYFVPTTTGEIATIDLRTGHVLARSKLASGHLPGNLAAGSGAIVSQSATEVTGFASLVTIEQQIAKKLQANPQDAQALALRGELRLHRGDEAAGLSDLRSSLKQQPDPHVKSVLAAALLAAVRAEPARIRDYVAELEVVADDPQQRNEFLRLYSKSLEAVGDLKGAFTQMIRLAETAQFLEDMDPIESGYSVRTDRLIRARLIEMYAAASAEERRELDRVLEQRIRATAAVPEQLDRCARFFSGLPTAEAVLLQSVMQMKDLKDQQRQQLLRSFQHSSDPAVAARSTALRAKALIDAAEWTAAAPLVRRLQKEFADQVALDGKSGRSLADAWLQKPELRQHVESRAVWPAGSMDPHRIPRTARTQRPNLPAEVITHSGTQLSGWSFETDAASTFLLARDASGVQRWKLNLPTDGEFADPDLRGMAIPCQIHIRDGWMALVHLTHFVVIDTASSNIPRIAWQQSLKAAGISTAELVQPRTRNRRLHPVGQVIGLTRETVIYSIGSKLVAGDLETGRLAWSRQDVISNQVSGSADDRVVAVRTDGSVTLVRTLDGSRIARRTFRNGTPLWNDGALWLLQRTTANGLTFELRNYEQDVAVWTRDCPAETEVTMVEDDDDLAFLEPTGRMTMVRWADGSERYHADLPLKLGAQEKSWFTVQRSEGRDIVMGGETYSHRVGMQVVPFDNSGQQTAVPFDGHVCGVSNSDGKLLWSTTVVKASFDRTQPADLPVLLLASRQLDIRNAGNPFQQRFRMTAKVIDKRTGREIYFTEEPAALLPPRIEPDPEHGRIVINFHEWQLDITFPDSDKAKSEK